MKEFWGVGRADWALLIPGVRTEKYFVEIGDLIAAARTEPEYSRKGHLEAEFSLHSSREALPHRLGDFLFSREVSAGEVRIYMKSIPCGFGGEPDQREVRLHYGGRSVSLRVISYPLFGGEEIRPSVRRRTVEVVFSSDEESNSVVDQRDLTKTTEDLLAFVKSSIHDSASVR